MTGLSSIILQKSNKSQYNLRKEGYDTLISPHHWQEKCAFTNEEVYKACKIVRFFRRHGYAQAETDPSNTVRAMLKEKL